MGNASSFIKFADSRSEEPRPTPAAVSRLRWDPEQSFFDQNQAKAKQTAFPYLSAAPFDIDDGYLAAQGHIVRERLKAAAIRLAAILNVALTPGF